MSKPTVSAAGGAMPPEGHKTRRAALGFLARSTARVSALACLPAVAMAASPAGDDAELLAMEVEIMRLRGLAKAICAEKVDPFEDEFIALMKGDGSEAAWAFARSYGRDDAINEAETFHLPADGLCERLMATPALTQAGRAAKVRVLLADILGDEWRGPDSELDWHRAQTRVLLGEFAGMSAEELADV
jgi:hypothetical protein